MRPRNTTCQWSKRRIIDPSREAATPPLLLRAAEHQRHKVSFAMDPLTVQRPETHFSIKVRGYLDLEFGGLRPLVDAIW